MTAHSRASHMGVPVLEFCAGLSYDCTVRTVTTATHHPRISRAALVRPPSPARYTVDVTTGGVASDVVVLGNSIVIDAAKMLFSYQQFKVGAASRETQENCDASPHMPCDPQPRSTACAPTLRSSDFGGLRPQ